MDISDLLSNVHFDYLNRFEPRAREHYRLLISLTRQFNNASFLDLGTSHGASAFCLAANPTNKVLSLDVDKNNKHVDVWGELYFKFPSNITFNIDDAVELATSFYDNYDIIMLDISHNGADERQIYDRICESSFSGLLIMDDINYKRFPELNYTWKNIKNRTKVELHYGHYSGTGLIPFDNIELVIS